MKYKISSLVLCNKFIDIHVRDFGNVILIESMTGM